MLARRITAYRALAVLCVLTVFAAALATILPQLGIWPDVKLFFAGLWLVGTIMFVYGGGIFLAGIAFSLLVFAVGALLAMGVGLLAIRLRR